VIHDYTNLEVSMAPLKNKAKRALFKSEVAGSFVLPPAVAPPNVVYQPATKVVAWPITIGLVVGAMVTIAGSMALTMIFCNKVPENAKT